MRNLVEHPITIGEIIECLQRSRDDLPKDLVGDIRPLLFDAAISHLAALPVIHAMVKELIESLDALSASYDEE